MMNKGDTAPSTTRKKQTYAAFSYRMYHSNIMDICPYDPFSRHSDRYPHRVKIGADNCCIRQKKPPKS